MKFLSLFCFGTMVALTSAAALDNGGASTLVARGCKDSKCNPSII